jgi:hypothetical protein
MAAYVFTLVMFFIWAVIGSGFLLLLQKEKIITLKLLSVSPAIGICLILLPTFLLNRLGLPVIEFAEILVFSFLIISLLYLVILRPRLDMGILGLLLITLLALIANSFPFMLYGFDWVGFMNDDMANYVLAARRFLHNGYLAPLNFQDYLSGKDYSQAYWFLHVAIKERTGSEILIALISACSHLSPLEVFMPIILALNLTLMFGVGSLVLVSGGSIKRYYMGMALIALSPLNSLSVVLQLIGQVGGLALATSFAAICFVPTLNKKFNLSLLFSAVPGGVLLAGIIVWYPEVLPFIMVSFLIFLCLTSLKYGKFSTNLLPIPILASLISLLLLGSYTIQAVDFMQRQANRGSSAIDDSVVLFPFFLKPSGIGQFWGLTALYEFPSDSYLTISIITGALITFWFIFFVLLRQIKNPTIQASFVLAMMGVMSFLAFKKSDFGLFKLAMFFQPFLIATIVCYKISAPTQFKKYLIYCLAFMFVALNLRSQFYVLATSTGELFGGLNQIPYASKLKVFRQFHESLESYIQKNGDKYIFVSDASNIVLAKLQALNAIGTPIFFPSRFFWTFGKNSSIDQSQYETLILNGNSFSSLRSDIFKSLPKRYIQTNAPLDIFNGYLKNRNWADDTSSYFEIKQNSPNFLQFIHSELGNHYYLGDLKRIGLYENEKDPYFRGGVFAGLGRHLLFEVYDSTPNPRAVLEFTTGSLLGARSLLPPIKIQDQNLDLVGRGSARVFSKPLDLTSIGDRKYLAIDTMRQPQKMEPISNGLMSLYGHNVSFDYRLISVFSRDISLLSSTQFKEVQSPSFLQNFPDDLMNRNLEYSGYYEDGWISEESYVYLQSKNYSDLIIKGFIPLVDNPGFKTSIQVKVDEDIVVTNDLTVGEFNLELPNRLVAGRHKVSISFTGYQGQNGPNTRFVAAKIKGVGFANKASTSLKDWETK